ncbi:MAG: hypothetical protein E7052_02245 [Lentisphaerae bacterium]|nr:hypothetical protein [Lentisphaerota bacterium]
MKKSWLLAAALLGAAGVSALEVSDNFTGGKFSGDWQKIVALGAKDLAFAENPSGGVKISGFTAENLKKINIVSYERKVENISGDFAAGFTLNFDLKDAAFMGIVSLQALGDDNKVIAECGLLDSWIAQGALAYGVVKPTPKTKRKGKNRLKNSGEAVFAMERSGNKYTFSCNGSVMYDFLADADTITKFRLQFQHSRYKGNDKLPPSHFGTFEVKNVQIKTFDRAAKVSAKAADNFWNDWRMVSVSGASGLNSKFQNGVLAIEGFTGTPQKVGAAEVVMERKLEPCSGDFTAAIDMDWDQISKAAMGEVVLQVLDNNGKVLVEGGLHDTWVAGAAQALGSIGEERAKTMFAMPFKAGGKLLIERRNGEYTVRIRDWKFIVGKGSDAPAAALRLIYSKRGYAGNAKKNIPPAHEINVYIREIAFCPGVAPLPPPRKPARTTWKHTKPIIWYWAGPDMSEEFAKELAAAGFNVAFGKNMFDLDIMHKYGIRGMLWMPGDPRKPADAVKLKCWLESVRFHPALLGVSCGDEPGYGKRMLKAQARVNFMKENAPEVLHFNNMYPMGASNMQFFGENRGLDKMEAYAAHIEDYCTRLTPQLLSYDAYHLRVNGDSANFFNNQAVIRKAALQRNIPSMNIVQACSWRPIHRIPTAAEYRYLAYSSLAYGSQGLSCYVYSWRGHRGGMRDYATQKTTHLYEEAKTLNRAFVAIATELMDLKSIAAYHTGTIPFGVEVLPENGIFQLEPKLENKPQGTVAPSYDNNIANNASKVLPRITGYVLGYFGKNNKATHVLVVNIDYKDAVSTTLTAPGNLERFDALKGTWSKLGSSKVKVDLPPGGGLLFRLEGSAE